MAGNEINVPVEVQKILPGVIGSIGAMLWINAPWPRRVAMVALGSAASYYGAQHLATMLGMGEGLSGFLVGLFGMSVVDSVFKTWADMGLSVMVRDWLRARLGLPPKEG